MMSTAAAIAVAAAAVAVLAAAWATWVGHLVYQAELRLRVRPPQPPAVEEWSPQQFPRDPFRPTQAEAAAMFAHHRASQGVEDGDTTPG